MGHILARATQTGYCAFAFKASSWNIYQTACKTLLHFFHNLWIFKWKVLISLKIRPGWDIVFQSLIQFRNVFWYKFNYLRNQPVSSYLNYFAVIFRFFIIQGNFLPYVSDFRPFNIKETPAQQNTELTVWNNSSFVPRCHETNSDQNKTYLFKFHCTPIRQYAKALQS